MFLKVTNCEVNDTLKEECGTLLSNNLCGSWMLNLNVTLINKISTAIAQNCRNRYAKIYRQVV